MAAALVVLGACSAGDDAGDDAAAAHKGELSDGAAGAGALAPDRDGSARDALVPVVDLGVGRDVVIEVYVVLASDDIERTVASIMATASSLGGGVASSDVDYGDGDDADRGRALIVVKVPPERVDRLLAGLDDTADVRSIAQSAHDVTEQIVDLEVRVRNARQSVTSVRELMSRAEDLDDLVTLEAELSQRLTQLERLEAQQRNLVDLVALSTITIEVRPAGADADAEPSTIGDAFRTGWEVFAAVMFGLGLLLAMLTPVLVAGAVIVPLSWLILRRLRSPVRPAGPRAGRRADDGDDADDDAVTDDEPVFASHED